MREIINLQIGQCGNNMGHQFLKRITLEHGMNSQGRYVGENDIQRQRINVYFNEVIDHTYHSRTVLADLQAGTIDALRGSKLGNLYNCDNFVVGLGSAGNNWAVGYYGKGSGLIQILLDSVRRQAESCDYLQGFQMFHSLCGGTGSGFGSLVLQRVFQEFSDRMFQTFTLFPSFNLPSNILESYNSVFSLLALNEKASMCHTLQNQSLEAICLNKRKLQKPSFQNLNEIVALSASDITCGFRFPGQINSSLRKMTMNLVPFRNLKFLISSTAPLQSQKSYQMVNREIFSELFSQKSFLSSSQSVDNQYMAGYAIFRGKVSTYQMQHFLVDIQNRSPNNCVEFIPNCFQGSLCNSAPPDKQLSTTLVANNNAIKHTFQKMSHNFNHFFKRKAYVHWYTNEGMDQLEFMDHQQKVRTLAIDYTYEQDEQEVLQ